MPLWRLKYHLLFFHLFLVTFAYFMLDYCALASATVSCQRDISNVRRFCVRIRWELLVLQLMLLLLPPCHAPSSDC